jgi:uncharacterized BrkB/YihY/UPF0761 family membrane protein
MLVVALALALFELTMGIRALGSPDKTFDGVPFFSIRALPVLLIFVAMFYWLWRVRRRRKAFVPATRDLPV